MDITKADDWMQKHVDDPCDVYHIAFPCTNLSNAKTVPEKTRSLENPYGSPHDAENVSINALVWRVMRWTLQLLAKGSIVMFENPLLSYFFYLNEVAGILGAEGYEMIRTDHCQDGAPYQKPQVFAANSAAIADVGRLCNHRQHAQTLEGAATRRSSPYPRSLCIRIV